MSDSKPVGPHACNTQALLMLAQSIPRQPVERKQDEGGFGFKAVQEKLQVLPQDTVTKPLIRRGVQLQTCRGRVSHVWQR